MDIKKRSYLIKKIESYYKEKKRKSLYFYPLALLYLENGNTEKAYNILLDGLKFFPRYQLALIKICEILMEENKYEAALAYLETLLMINKINPVVNFYLAVVYEHIREYDKSLKYYRIAFDLGNTEEEVLIGIKRLMKRDEEAAPTFVTKNVNFENIPEIELGDIDTTEEDDIATIMLAKLYEKQGYINDAINTYKKILSIDKDNLEAKENLEKLENSLK